MSIVPFHFVFSIGQEQFSHSISLTLKEHFYQLLPIPYQNTMLFACQKMVFVAFVAATAVFGAPVEDGNVAKRQDYGDYGSYGAYGNTVTLFELTAN
jgi:hypothetical protein